MDVLLDNDWKFHPGDIPFAEIKKNSYAAQMAGNISGPVDPKLDDSGWQAVELPHDWTVDARPAPDGNVDQGFLPRGIGWYRRHFASPAPVEGKKVYLDFEGVARNSTAWLNGFRLGTHRSGYTGFRFDVSDILLPENVLSVRVDATEIEGWWCEGCGIYRHVRLLVREQLHFEPWGVSVLTLRVSPEQAEIRLEAKIRNENGPRTDFTLQTKIFDADGRVVSQEKTAASLEPGAGTTIPQNLFLKNPALWSPEEPNLHRLKTEIALNGAVADCEEISLGVRRFEFTADKGFFLNGRPYKIQGTCNHQDFAGVGVALPDRLHRKKIELLKQVGCNAYRCAHHPPAPALLDACDRLGMLVMDENRHLDSSEEGIADLRSMIRRDRNHPSVILWCLENEEALEGKETGAKILKTLYRTAKDEDPTRPVTAAICHDWNGAGYADVLDLAGYNYSHAKYGEEHRTHPDRKMFGSEINASYSVRGIYENGNGYCNAYSETINGVFAVPADAWRAIAENEFMAGGFVWSGFDYRGEPAPYEWPNVISQFGLMDLCGFPKDVYYYYKSVWTKEPVLHILPHWNWPGKEGRPIRVRCYSNCEQVELFRNGKSLGQKDMPKNGFLEWMADYEPGILSATGYRDGKEVAADTKRTSGLPARLVLAGDRGSINPDGTDVACVTAQIVDEDGVFVPTADNTLTFRIAGPAKILGLGNGDQKDHSPDKGDRRQAFNGLCLALVQAGKEPGTAVLTVSSGGLPTAVLKINVG